MEKLHSSKLSSTSGAASTQKYVDVAEVRDGVIVLKNHSLRGILLMSSINFDLKSSDEQDAIILQYQNFLNSLDFPTQILVQSRRLNIVPYLEMLDDRERRTSNELLRQQIIEHRSFIKNLTQITNIMSKYFYVIVPFSPIESSEGGFFSNLMATFNKSGTITAKREQFDTYKNQLLQRMDHVTTGLSRTGVRGTMLNTEEVLELLYNSYNPSLFANSSLSDIEHVNVRNFNTG